MRSLPQKIQALRGCVAATVCRWAMTVGSIIRKHEPLLPEERFFRGDELVAIPESHTPGGDRTAGSKFFPANLEEFGRVSVRRIGLLEDHGRFCHLAILEFHQADTGGCPANIEFL